MTTNEGFDVIGCDVGCWILLVTLLERKLWARTLLHANTTQKGPALVLRPDRDLFVAGGSLPFSPSSTVQKATPPGPRNLECPARTVPRDLPPPSAVVGPPGVRWAFQTLVLLALRAELVPRGVGRRVAGAGGGRWLVHMMAPAGAFGRPKILEGTAQKYGSTLQNRIFCG